MSVVDEASACVPLSVQICRLHNALAERQVAGVSVVEVELFDLVGEDLDAALDGVAAGEPSPFVLIDGRLVCTGTVDAEKVFAALEAAV